METNEGLTHTQEVSGITLVALVVTIVVLLILAGISLNFILGQNGLVRKTKDAKELTEVAEEKEIVQMSVLGLRSKNHGSKIFSRAELEGEIKNNAPKRQVQVTEEGPFVVTFLDTNREYIVEGDGAIEKMPDKVKDTTPGALEGSGEKEDPYKIQSIEDLVQLSIDYNNGSIKEKAYFELLEDLNFMSKNSYVDADRTDFGDVNGDGKIDTLKVEMTTGKGFTPIGNNYTYRFDGNINGNGHTISNLYINNDDYYIGFIGRTKDAITIENLNLSKVNITGKEDVGSIVGLIEYDTGALNISNCNVSGNITSTGRTGGMIGKIKAGNSGENSIVIDNCHSSININSSNDRVGGIVGLTDSDSTIKKLTVRNCSNQGNISGNGAGIIGSIYRVQELIIQDSYNTGSIQSEGSYVSGVLGECQNTTQTTIEGCYNKGNINGYNYVAGIIGRITGNNIIQKCYNKGIIQSNNDAGGIASSYEGNSSYNVVIQKCYNEGNVTANNSCGGIIFKGENVTSINQCYNKAEITATNGQAGGIAATQITSVGNCYNQGDVKSERGQAGGIVGTDISSVINCYNVGDVYSKTNTAAGIVSFNYATINIQNVYNLGAVNSEGNNSSGIIAYSSSEDTIVKNAYNFGKIDGVVKPIPAIGALTYVKEVDKVDKCYYLKGTAEVGTNNSALTGKIQDVEVREDLKTILIENLKNIDGWSEDSNNINDGYPILNME